ncbi:rapid alkalinization factor-like [Dioscorea cayenensis subsp. rotundata]|uniref:Rapid alkalinization factor-like n=1 Tax=Dioscorea cayennensis subsp. rotundata TaxID=55577 RepID=A0AB40AWR0_DIOCR|nr:rapid alkalinization factor-like [Dioscorea cayenensis subsp. rotundata]
MALRIMVILLLITVAFTTKSSAGKITPITFTSLAEADGGLNESKTCNGIIGDCVSEEDEMNMDSETNRRSLMYARRGRASYISYGALMKNRVPCNRRGSSYYNCRKGRRANPYRRGCSVITKCARYLK